MRLATVSRIAAISLTAVAVGGGAFAQGSSPTVSVQAFQFTPSPMTVKPGTTVTWVNRDDIQHTVTAGVPDQRSGKFDLRLAGDGTSAGTTFSEPGVYPYFCSRHRSMRGEIRVN